MKMMTSNGIVGSTLLRPDGIMIGYKLLVEVMRPNTNIVFVTNVPLPSLEDDPDATTVLAEGSQNVIKLLNI